jgi:hypothetical protein
MFVEDIMAMKRTFLSLSLFLVLGLLAGMLVKNLAMGALGGLACHLLVLGAWDLFGKRSEDAGSEKEK